MSVVSLHLTRAQVRVILAAVDSELAQLEQVLKTAECCGDSETALSTEHSLEELIEVRDQIVANYL